MDALQLLGCFRRRRQRTQPRRSVTARGHHSEFQRRVIPQIYAPESYEQVKALGYEQIIWTRYRYPGPCSRDPAVARSLRGAVCHHYAALPCQQPLIVARRGVPTYVHTMNNPEERELYAWRFGVTDVYTDFLGPSD